MNALRTALEAIAAYGLPVLLGVTAVLASGIVVLLCHRSPAQRRRLGVLTAVGALLYLLVGLAPLPRLAAPGASRDDQVVPRALAASATAFSPALDAEARAALLLRAMDGLTTPAAENATPAVLSAPSSTPPPSLAAASANTVPAAAAFAWIGAVPWSLVLAGLYAGGVLFALVRTFGAQLRLASLLAACRPVPAATLRFASVPAGTRVVSTSRSLRPFCTGVRQPVIVLPEALLAVDRAAEATAVLRHEVAHVRAHDPRVWSLLAWLAVPLWCHPLFWWLCRQVRFCSELLADDVAARAGDRQRYARALIELAERSTHDVAAAGTVAIFHRPSEFYRRIQMLLSRQGSLSTQTSRMRRFAQSFSMLCLVGFAASVFGVPATAQDPERTLRRENAELRASLDTLRSELATLRDQIALLRATAATDPSSPPSLVGALSSSPELAKDLAAQLQQLKDLQVSMTGTLRSGALPSRSEPIDPSSVSPPAAQDPVAAPPAGVPVLGELPLLGNLFRSERVAAAASEPAPVPDLTDVRMGRLDENGTFTPALRDYTVQKGDTLARIAARELGSAARVAEVLEHNPGIEPQKLRVGQQLKLPIPGSAAAEFGQFPGAGAASPGSTGETSDGRVRELLTERGFGAAVAETAPAPAPSPTGVAALAELTSRYLDLQAELELQRIEATEAKKLVEAGRTPQREALRAEVTLRATEKKLAIAARLIDGEIAATEAELQWIESRRADCSPSEAKQLEMQAQRARTRLDALQAVK